MVSAKGVSNAYVSKRFSQEAVFIKRQEQATYFPYIQFTW